MIGTVRAQRAPHRGIGTIPSPDIDWRGDPMTARPRPGHMRKARLLAGATILLAAAIVVGTSGTASAAPCDIYASGGTPCVAAHSTTRALFDAYNGPLYQVRRSSDNTTRDIGLLSVGGS